MATTKKEMNAYWAALGEFIDSFSTVETTMAFIVRLESNTDEATAHVLFSSIRIDQAKTYINQLNESRGRKDKDLERIFSQLNRIVTARNDIVHYGAHKKEVGFIVSNAMGARTQNKLREILVDPQYLNLLIRDLHIIKTGLMYYFLKRVEDYPNSLLWKVFSEFPEDRTKMLADLHSASQAPWHYKFS